MGKNVLLLILALIVSRQGEAGIFGPSTYDECILEKMKGVSSDVAADEVKKACRRRYPGAPSEDTTKAKAASGSEKAASPKAAVSRQEAAKTPDVKKKSGEIPAGNKWESYGDSLYRQGKYEKAAKAYSSALVKASLKDLSKAEIYIKRSQAYRELKEYPHALRDANKAIAFNSQEARLFELRASLYYSMGSYRLAITDYGEAIRLNPRESKYYDMRALAFKAGGNTRQALQDIATAITINPKDHTAYGLRGD
ncbi:MAG: tetratricopeptide repeat protein, partial [Nitrospirae bacterium]|nr:tetratricopeptide repeat protein [Nitrospirota bacterium]